MLAVRALVHKAQLFVKSYGGRVVTKHGEVDPVQIQFVKGKTQADLQRLMAVAVPALCLAADGNTERRRAVTPINNVV